MDISEHENNTSDITWSEKMAENIKNITLTDVRVGMGKKVESLGRWIQDPKPVKTPCHRPGSPLLVGICLVLVLATAAIAVLSKVIYERLLNERWQGTQEYGPYPEPHVMINLVKAGYGATGAGLAVAVLGLIMTCWKPRWLLTVGMLLCVAAIILSLAIVGYGATAHIFETKSHSRRVERVFDNVPEYYNYYTYDYEDLYYKNRHYLKRSFSGNIINYYQVMLNAWKQDTKMNKTGVEDAYLKVKNMSNYYMVSQHYPWYPPSSILDDDPSTADLLNHLEDVLDLFSLLADAHGRLIKEDSGQFSNCSHRIQELGHGKVDCMLDKDKLRRTHMLDLYRGLIAMGTLQMLLVLAVAIKTGQDCCNGCRKQVIVYLHYPEEDSPLQTIASVMSENINGATGMIITSKEDDSTELLAQQC